MDKLIEKIIEKTELKNWTLFLFIFAICYIFWLHSIEGKWFAIPKTEYHNTTMFLLEVFLSSLTITRFLVAIKFLEAINRTPIIADIINWVIVERREVFFGYRNRLIPFLDARLIEIEFKNDDEPVQSSSVTIRHAKYYYRIEIVPPISSVTPLMCINWNLVVEDELYVDHKEFDKKIVMGRDDAEKSLSNGVIFKLNPALYRHLDKNEYGFWLIGKFNKKGKWKKGRKLCLEHFLTVGIILGAAYVAGIVIRLFL